jgi:hypothetical protein
MALLSPRGDPAVEVRDIEPHLLEGVHGQRVGRRGEPYRRGRDGPISCRIQRCARSSSSRSATTTAPTSTSALWPSRRAARTATTASR